MEGKTLHHFLFKGEGPDELGCQMGVGIGKGVVCAGYRIKSTGRKERSKFFSFREGNNFIVFSMEDHDVGNFFYAREIMLFVKEEEVFLKKGKKVGVFHGIRGG